MLLLLAIVAIDSNAADIASFIALAADRCRRLLGGVINGDIAVSERLAIKYDFNDCNEFVRALLSIDCL